MNKRFTLALEAIKDFQVKWIKGSQILPDSQFCSGIDDIDAVFWLLEGGYAEIRTDINKIILTLKGAAALYTKPEMGLEPEEIEKMMQRRAQALENTRIIMENKESIATKRGEAI
jgi:hypothetical protein